MDQAKAEVLRYLGRREQEVPSELDRQIKQCMELVRDAATPRNIWRRFAVIDEGKSLLLANTGLKLYGNDIRNHIFGCDETALLAVTLGVGVDTLIRQQEHIDLTNALILDASATQFIEEICGEIEQQIRDEVEASGLLATGRYSPGYGDFGLEIQKDFLAVLDTGRKIGLTCTENMILLPHKSVTAVIGIGYNLTNRPSGCEHCTLKNSCIYRKDGTIDGCQRMAEQ